MSDTCAAAISNCDYRDLIQEVFIKPIRSVLIVDDEFPTLDRMLADTLPGKESREKGRPIIPENADRVLKLLNYCREKDRNWLVDVHDGKDLRSSEEANLITHLHQSDLLVLDYKLDGDEADAGKAISILRSLAKNDHFNLVVVYTQDRSSSVFKSIVLSLLASWEDIIPSDRSNVPAEVSKWEDKEESILKHLQDCVTEDTYLRFRRRKKYVAIDSYSDDPDVKRFIDLFEKKPVDVDLKKDSLFKWLLNEVGKKLGKQLSLDRFGDVTWSKDSEEVNWIRTNRLFITVIPKAETPAEQLPRKLLDALTAWSPEPPRLIMSKMRTELDAHGVSAEDDALSDELIQAIWFLELLQASDEERQAKIMTSISRHWEGLLGTVETNIIEFTKRLFGHLQCDPSEHNDCVKRHFGVDLQDDVRQIDALLRQNAYNCSKPPEGWHLTTGHVLKMDGEYWVCLSPACDLVPEQKVNARYTALSPAMPFKAVKLKSFGRGRDNQKDALEKANSNMCLFLKIADSIQPFHFTAPDKHLANPTWEEMFADNFGKFNQASNKMKIARLKWNQETGGPACEWKEAEIISQLRYEYALNLLQRLGSTLSRIGLDFVEFKGSNTLEITPGSANGQADA
jgi:CheY-like chemotaxis protein